MSDEIEREIRSIRRQFFVLRSGITNPELLDPLSKPRGLRLGSMQRLVFPHEGILDAIWTFAGSVWHFKDYLKVAVSRPQAKAVEAFAEQSLDLKVVADLANEKKHARVDRPRSGLSPKLGILDGGTLMLGVVRFDTSRNGMIEFAYNGKNKAHRFWVTNALPILFGSDIIVTTPDGPASKGDAVTFIHGAFKQWERLLPTLGIQIRKDFTE